MSGRDQTLKLMSVLGNEGVQKTYAPPELSEPAITSTRGGIIFRVLQDSANELIWSSHL